MKKEKLFRAMSLADEKYVDEANEIWSSRKKKPRLKVIIALAAVLSVLVSLSLWLFIPLKDARADISAYADSEYYEVIQKLHAASYRAPRHKNNFQKYIKRGFLSVKEEAMDDAGSLEMGATGTLTNSSSSYKEITDNQVAGVIEADLIKRTDTHIFYLDGKTLRAYSILGENSAEVGSFNIDNVTQSGASSYNTEFYLSIDGKTLTLILPHDYSEKPFVKICALNVTDPSKIELKSSFSVSGSILSTRYTNGELLVMSRFSPKLDYSDPTCFVPSVSNGGEEMTALSPEKIIAPDALSDIAYTVISRLDAQSLECIDTLSLLSYVGDAYVSEDTVFATRTFHDSTEAEDGVVTSGSKTEIIGVSYIGEKMAHIGSITVNGQIKDQYSLDAYGGMLRVATTVDDHSYKVNKRDDGLEIYDTVSNNGLNASLWCIDLSDWTLTASVERFAPDGETVRSVRFDGEYAYICTAIQAKDPVFFFNLSDLSNITYTQTGTIEGFSTSLVDFVDGYLLGIGVNASGFLKVEVYEEKEGKVVSVCKYEPKNTNTSEVYKSYYIDRENALIGIPTMRPSTSTNGKLALHEYTLLSFSDRALTEKLRVSLGGHDPSVKRGAYIDGYFYMFGENDFRVEKIELD